MKTTTREGFLMNTFRRIPRYMVKALAAGAVLVAATLPLAVATEAGAAAVPASSYLTLTQVGGVPANADLGAAGSPAIFAQGWTGTGTFVLSTADGLNLAGGGNAAVTSTAVGVTFTAGAESPASSGVAAQVVTTITAGAAVPAGYYPATITDAAGTVTIPNAFYVDAAPTFTSMAPASIPGGNSNIPAVVTGTGFTPTSGSTPGTTVVFGVGSVGGTITPSSTTYVSPTTLDVIVSTGTSPTGLYAATVTNADGGKTTATTGLTVTGPTITAISPASLAVPATGSATTTVTITGTGFETGAVVSITAGGTGVTVGTVTYTSSTSMSVALTVASGTGAEQSTLKITNPDLSSATLAAGLGIGTASAAAATVTAVTPSLSLTIGSVANLTITGTGFGPARTTAGPAAVTFLSTAGIADTHVVCSAVTVTSDTSLTCTLAVSTGAISGPHAVEVLGNSGNTVESNVLANALTILGPTITSVAPASVPADFVGVLTLTGTGFSAGTLTATVLAGATDSETGVTAAYVSPTQVTVTNTGSTISALDSPAIVTLTDNGALANFAVPVVIPPTITSVKYAGATTGVGQGATAQPITIVGTGFLPAPTVTFGATSGITATVVSVTPTAIPATVKVSSTAAVGAGLPANAFTVTNTNGGSTGSTLTVDAGVGTLYWNPAHTITTASVKNGTSGTLVLYSTGIAAGATVASSSGLVTLGTPVVSVAAGTISIPWIAAAIVGTVPVGLSVTVSNVDGGSSAFALTVSPGPTVVGSYYVPTSVTNFEVTVVGTGFETGMTVASNNAAYTVSLGNINSTNTAATLLVTTTAAATSGTFATITFTNPDLGTVSFALNGGPAPVVTVVTVTSKPKITSVTGFPVLIGKWTTLTIHGANLAGLVVSSNGASVKKLNGGTTLVKISVKPTAGKKAGVYTLTARTAHGSATYQYSQKKK